MSVLSYAVLGFNNNKIQERQKCFMIAVPKTGLLVFLEILCQILGKTEGPGPSTRQVVERCPPFCHATGHVPSKPTT